MILVTGGLGFIGSNFLNLATQNRIPGFESEKFLVLDCETYAGSRDNIKIALESGRVEIVFGDIREAKVVFDCIRKSDGVIHFAAESHVDRSIASPGIFLETNIMGTFNLLNAVAKESIRMLVVSTDEVYGSLAHGSATELSILAPSSAYSASKAAADLLAESYAKTYDADIIITRSVNNYGIQQHSEKFIPTIIESISSNKKVPIYGDGSNIRNWLHVEDHCLGIALAFLHGKTFEIFNFGSKDYISNLDLVLAFVNYFDANTNLISFVVDRKGHDARYSVDYSKATRELGWEPKKNLMQSIPELSSWYMKNNSIRNGMSPHEK